MIYRDRIIVRVSGGKKANGDPLPSTDFGPFPADVQPLSTEEKQLYGEQVTTRLRLFYRSLPIAGGLKSNAIVVHDGRAYDVVGTPEAWKVNGRVDHYEATISRTS